MIEKNTISSDKLKTKKIKSKNILTDILTVDENIEVNKYNKNNQGNVEIYGYEYINGNSNISNILQTSNLVSNDVTQKKFQPNITFGSFGDSWFSEKPSFRNIPGTNMRVNQLLNISNTAKIIQNSGGFTISNFINSSCTRFYDKTSNIFCNQSFWFHFGTNDTHYCPVNNISIFSMDNIYTIQCLFKTMLILTCIPKNNIYIAKDIFDVTGTNWKLLSTPSWLVPNTLYGSIQTNINTISLNDTINSSIKLNGRYYFFFIWSETNSESTNYGEWEILINGNVESILRFPRFNNYNYLQQYNTNGANPAANASRTLWWNTTNTINPSVDIFKYYVPSMNPTNTFNLNNFINIHPWPIVVDMKTKDSRTVGVRVKKLQNNNSSISNNGLNPTYINQGIALVGVWDDETGTDINASQNDKFQNVIVSKPVIFADVPAAYTLNYSFTSYYNFSYQFQDRYYNIYNSLENIVRGLQQLKLPVNIFHWNNISNAWYADYLHATSHMVETNATSFINNIKSKDIPLDANVKANNYDYTNIL